MAFPTIPTVAAGRVLTTNQLDSSGTRTFPNLSSLTKNAGDLLIAIIVTYQSTTNPQFSSWGGGFSEVHDSGTSSTLGIGIATKISDGTETGTFTVTQAGTITGDASMILLSIPGAHATTAIEVGTRVDGTGAAADPASFDPGGWGAEDTLWISLVGSGMTSATGSWTATGTTAPTNYTDRVDTNASDTSTIGDVEAAVAFRQLNASSEDVGTAGVDTSNARNSAVVIAVRPAAAAQTLSGAVYANGPSFNAGTVSPGGVTLAGAVFSNAPAFNAGILSSNYTLTGVLYSNPPNFGGTGYLDTSTATNSRAQIGAGTATAWSTGTIEHIVCVRNANWYPGSNAAFTVGHHRGQFTFLVRSGASAGDPGVIQMRYHDGSTLLNVSSNANIPSTFASTDWVWFRFVIVPGGHTGDFYYSLDPVTTSPGSVSWTQIGTQVSGAALTIRAAASPVTGIGGDSTMTGSNSGNSDFAVAVLALNGSTVADPDFRDADQGWNSPPATDSLGNSWALNGDATWSANQVGTVIQGAAQINGVVFANPPVFNTGAVTPGNVTLSGVVFSNPPVFVAGTITATYTLAGVVFSNPPAFAAGSITSSYTIVGNLFARPPNFFAGTISATYTISGAVFVAAPEFFAGTITQGGVVLQGVLFTNPPVFTAGTITPGNVTISGVVFSNPPVFAAGTVTATYTISGVVFTNPPVFTAGTISATYTLTGVLFANPPVFAAGTITVTTTLTGAVFSNPPVFVAGTVTAGGVTITGVVFSNPPVFIAGVLSAGTIISGVVFSNPPVFVAGVITAGGVTLSGVVFANPPVFAQGSVLATYALTGVVFSNPPVFTAGRVLWMLTGVVFSNPPAFFAGDITTIATLLGVTFNNPPVFSVGFITGIGLVSDDVTIVIGELGRGWEAGTLKRIPGWKPGTLQGGWATDTLTKT